MFRDSELTYIQFNIFKMKKYLLLLMLPLFMGGVSACDDDDDTLDPSLIKGIWEVAADDNNDFTAVYNFGALKGWSNYGTVEVRYYNADGSENENMASAKYDWHAAGPQGNNGILDITLTPYEVDADDPGFFYETYMVTDLTSSRMEWKGLEPNPVKR